MEIPFPSNVQFLTLAYTIPSYTSSSLRAYIPSLIFFFKSTLIATHKLSWFAFSRVLYLSDFLLLLYYWLLDLFIECKGAWIVQKQVV